MENEDQVKENNHSGKDSKEEGPKLANEGNPSEPIAESNRLEPTKPPFEGQGGRKTGNLFSGLLQ